MQISFLGILISHQQVGGRATLDPNYLRPLRIVRCIGELALITFMVLLFAGLATFFFISLGGGPWGYFYTFDPIFSSCYSRNLYIISPYSNFDFKFKVFRLGIKNCATLSNKKKLRFEERNKMSEYLLKTKRHLYDSHVNDRKERLM